MCMWLSSRMSCQVGRNHQAAGQCVVGYSQLVLAITHISMPLVES